MRKILQRTKRGIIHLLTAIMPIGPLRKVYILWHKLTSWWWYGDYKFPRIINIEVATHCNRSCTYCPNIVHPEKARLIKEDVLNTILYRLKELRWKGVVDFIFFNEPTLHPDLAGIVRKVKESAPYCIPRISTNGDMLTSARIQSYVDAGMDRIYVMRHNPTPDGWVQKMTRLKHEFPGVVQLMDIDELEQTQGLHDFNGLVEVKKHRPRFIVDGRARCQVHRHVCQITVDGEWDLCCVDYARTHKFGSLMHHSFLEIWNDPKFKRIRDGLEDGRPMTKTCSTCTCLVERKPEHQRKDFMPRTIGERQQKQPSMAV
jgi:radical SAM family protein/iron-sulfur cluster protein